MSRPTRIYIDCNALMHNLKEVKKRAPQCKIIAMVKARAYGCGFSQVVPVLENDVWAFGVASIEEAMAIRALGVKRDCILMQGVFTADELEQAALEQFQVVIHQQTQLEWLLQAKNLANDLRIWVKVNTGMNRLGFPPERAYDILNAVHACPWVQSPIGLMTHLACADAPDNPHNKEQLDTFATLRLPEGIPLIRSIANSAGIMGIPSSHSEVLRPGIMLYGVSPHPHATGAEEGLMPVMHFLSAITAIQHYPAGAYVGYGSTWQTQRPSVIGVIPVGYADGYPRHIAENTPVWVNGQIAPIVGRISMDMLTVDLTDCKAIKLGDVVELWGKYIPVETIAQSAGSIPYELLCQFSPRASR